MQSGSERAACRLSRNLAREQLGEGTGSSLNLVARKLEPYSQRARPLPPSRPPLAALRLLQRPDQPESCRAGLPTRIP
jgi:hypothetical protein